MIKREQYLTRLRKLKDRRVIKVITGVRRSGKSTLLKQFQQELLDIGVKSQNIVYLNLEETENEAMLERHVLHDYIMRLADPKVKNYVFLDEIQNVPQFEKLADSLYVKDHIDLYITGSNAYMLSSDLATFLSGRYLEINILPFSFKEFAAAYHDGAQPAAVFNDYLAYGGFPEVSNFLHAGAGSEIGAYLRGVYATVYQKDIKTRKKIRSNFDFEAVMKFAFDETGSIVSPNKIAESLRTGGGSMNKATVEGYLQALQDAFILYRADRFDVKGKKLLQTLNKYYTVDIGLLRAILGKDRDMDRGHILENIVYLELTRRAGEVRIGKVGDTEVDFVVTDKDGFTEYYQTAYSVRDETTLRRELAPFGKIKDHNLKTLLTLDPETASWNGVRQINAIDWLRG
jgi:predicted AAA+ superfamily ATPase